MLKNGTRKMLRAVKKVHPPKTSEHSASRKRIANTLKVLRKKEAHSGVRRMVIGSARW